MESGDVMDLKAVATILLLLLLVTPFAFARNSGWAGDTYNMLVQLIGFKPVYFYSSQNFAVEWVKENPDGSLTVHLIEVN